MNLMKCLKKCSPVILSVAGAVGVAVTAVLAVKATPKAMELTEDTDGGTEKVKAAWKCYIPAAAVGAASIVCILSANVLTRRHDAAITSAYIMLGQSYKDYRSKVKERYGEKAHRDILKAIHAEHCENVSLQAEAMCANTSLDMPNDERDMLFYDFFSKRYFTSTLPKVLQAEYHLNRNFVLRGYSPLHEWYEFLGLEPIEGDSEIGWSAYNGDMMWIDFNHTRSKMDDGLECCIIDTIFEPDTVLDYI